MIKISTTLIWALIAVSGASLAASVAVFVWTVRKCRRMDRAITELAKLIAAVIRRNNK